MTEMATELLHRRKQHHLKHLDCSLNSFVFFLTLCTNNKKAYFSNSQVCEIIVGELEHRRLTREIKLFCYCLLPDHLHLLISFDETYVKKTGAFGECALQNWVSAFKRYTSRIAGQTCGIKPLWQGNFYDHVVRDDESLLEICQYILDNPVRKGLAPSWREYPYSRIVDSLPI
jgi:putative transposase